MINRLKELLFQNRSTRQTITKNVFWLSISQVASRLIRVAIIIYSARMLGVAEYGIFSYALGLAGFFTIFADIGINQILTRDVSQKPEYSSQYFSTAFLIKILLFLTTALLIIFITPYFSKVEKINILIPYVAFIVIFDGLREFSLAFFRAKEKMELEALAMVLTNSAITIFGFVALYFSVTSQSITFSYAAATGFGALATVFILKKEFTKITSYFEKKLVRPIIVAAWPTALVSILGAFMLNTDIIMLGWWRTAEEIGYYSASQRIIQMLYVLPAVIAGAFFPALSRFIGEKQNEKIKLLIEKSVSTVFSLAIPLTVGGVILGKAIIELIYGQEYLQAVSTFKILIFTVLVIFPGTIIGNSVLAYNQQKRMAVFIAVAAIGNVILNAILIPLYGIFGSAIATIVSQFISNSLSWRILKKTNNFQTFVHLKKLIAAAVIMGIFSFIMDKFGLNVIVNIIVSAGIYFGTLYLFKEKILGEVFEIFKRFKPRAS